MENRLGGGRGGGLIILSNFELLDKDTHKHTQTHTNTHTHTFTHTNTEKSYFFEAVAYNKKLNTKQN